MTDKLIVRPKRTEKMDIKLTGQRIRAARQSLNLTMAELAELVGIATETLGHIECGARNTGLQTLIKIADTLNVSLDYLTGRSPTPLASLLQESLADESLTADQKKMLPEMLKGLLPYIKKTK